MELSTPSSMCARPCLSVGRPKSMIAWPIDDGWRGRMRAKMKGRMTQVDLAKKLGTTAANVNRMLTPLAEGGWAASAHAVRAGEIVGEPLPLPSDGKIDEEATMLMRRLFVISPLAYADTIADVQRQVERLERAIKKSSRLRKP